MNPKQKEKNSMFLEGFDSLIFATVFVLVVLTFFARTARVYGGSMDSTLEDGDQVLVYSFLYKPKVGDVVVIDSYIDYGKPLVKRVIAVAGDEVLIDDEGVVFVNGVALNEPYISSPTVLEDLPFPVVVPQGKVFVMGDNRSNSLDSRSSDVGFIDEREILGKVVLRLFPTNDFGIIE